jgi:hypothetical protein
MLHTVQRSVNGANIMALQQDPADLIYLDSQQADPPKLHSGPGEGLPCDHCGEIIEPSQIEYQLEARGEKAPARLHVHCYASWCEQAQSPE